MKTDLAVAPTTTRAKIRPTGAEQTPIGIMASGRASQGAGFQVLLRALEARLAE